MWLMFDSVDVIIIQVSYFSLKSTYTFYWFNTKLHVHNF